MKGVGRPWGPKEENLAASGAIIGGRGSVAGERTASGTIIGAPGPNGAVVGAV